MTLASGWLMPMPRLADGRAPVISDGWGSPRDGGARTHKGADVMYRRPIPVTSAAAKLEHGSKNYEVPQGTEAFAAGDGMITDAKLTSRGHAVVIDHGNGWQTFYQHLEALAPGISAGRQVAQGTVLGTVGYDPLDVNGIRHLHFEIWNERSAVPPESYMKTWAVKSASAGGSLLTVALLGFIGWGLYRATR